MKKNKTKQILCTIAATGILVSVVSFNVLAAETPIINEGTSKAQVESELIDAGIITGEEIPHMTHETITHVEQTEPEVPETPEVTPQSPEDIPIKGLEPAVDKSFTHVMGNIIYHNSTTGEEFSGIVYDQCEGSTFESPYNPKVQDLLDGATAALNDELAELAKDGKVVVRQSLTTSDPHVVKASGERGVTDQIFKEWEYVVTLEAWIEGGKSPSVNPGPKENNNKTNVQTTSPKTGDSERPIVWISASALAAALAGAGTLVLTRKKSSKKSEQ